MRRALGIAIVVTAALWPAGNARAESSQGGAFQPPPYGARVWGMGGVGVAVVDDESALDWNPARLSLAPRTLGASYVDLVPGAGVGQAQLVFVTPFGHPSSEDSTVATHAGGIMLTNISADIIGGESYTENHLRAAYAYCPEPLVTFAIAGQLFFSRSGVDGFDAWGTGIDLAGRLSLTRNWDVGVVGRDVFSRYTYSDGRDYQKQRQIVIGLATRTLPFAVVSVDAVHAYSGWSRVMAGVETPYIFGLLAVRAGVTRYSTGEARTAPSFGASVRTGRLTAHYGANLDTEEAFGTVHRLSLAVRL